MGKWSLLMVMGFSLIALQIMPTVNKRVNDAYSNYMTYWDSTQAHNLAASAANMAANIIFENPTNPSVWQAGIPSTSFAGGTLKATMGYMAGTDSANIKIVASGVYQGVPDSVFVVLEPGSFARFAYFSNIEGSISWGNQDTVWGPFHTQDKMNIIGRPTFWGKVSALKGTNPTKSNANFYGGYQSGVNIPLPGNLSSVTTAATAGGKVVNSGDLYITFANDTVKWKTTPAGAVTNTLLSAFAPNGVILVKAGSLHIQGKLKGQVTVATSGSGKSVWIDDDMVMSSSPQTNPNSTDMLGICSLDSVYVTKNTANSHDCTIEAAIFCLNGGLAAEGVTTSSPLWGGLTVYGGIQQNKRAVVCYFDGSGNVNAGFQKNYYYDNRLMIKSPPFYPATGTYQIISWLE